MDTIECHGIFHFFLQIITNFCLKDLSCLAVARFFTVSVTASLWPPSIKFDHGSTSCNVVRLYAEISCNALLKYTQWLPLQWLTQSTTCERSDILYTCLSIQPQNTKSHHTSWLSCLIVAVSKGANSVRPPPICKSIRRWANHSQ